MSIGKTGMDISVHCKGSEFAGANFSTWLSQFGRKECFFSRSATNRFLFLPLPKVDDAAIYVKRQLALQQKEITYANLRFLGEFMYLYVGFYALKRE